MDKSSLLYKKFYAHKTKAKSRGLKSLSFSEYCKKIEEAGITANMIGRRKADYQLCRYSDEGDYTVNSCRFATREENYEDGRKNGLYKRIAKFKIGKTKHTNNTLMAMSKANEKPFALISNCGKLVIGINLFQFCKNNGLNQSNMWNAIYGAKNTYKEYRRPSKSLLRLIKFD